MGAFTPIDEVWYPDEDDTAEQNVNLSTLASSVEEGIGARLRHQEIAIGLKGSLEAASYTIPAGTATVIPYGITGVRGDFNNGFTFANGVVTIQTTGMYLVSASVGPNGFNNGGGVKLYIDKNGSFIAGNEVALSTQVWVGTTATAVLNCVPGDTIRARGLITGGAPSIQNSGESTHMSVTMVQALPL